MKKKVSFINILRRDIRNQTARSLHFRVYLAYGKGRFCRLLGRVQFMLIRARDALRLFEMKLSGVLVV